MRRWGGFVYRRRRALVALSVLAFAGSIAGIATGGQLQNANSFSFESSRGFSLINDQLPSSGVGFGLVLTDPRWAVTDPRYRAEVTKALATLVTDHRVSSVRTPYDAGAGVAARLISSDGHSMIATVSLRLSFSEARQQFGDLRAKVAGGALSIAATGDVALAHDFDSILASDLEKAEIGSSVVALVLLVLVFGTGVAALVCLAVGLLSVTGGVAAALALAHVMDVSTYALNVVTLIGLGIAIDYSLFIVSRFREELAAGRSVEAAVSIAMATAGRAIAFSGITVAIGLAAMLFYPGTFLVSMGLAGAMVVAVSVLMVLTFLPALLAVLGHRVNRLTVPILRPRPFGQGVWHRVAVAVMRRPVAVLLPTAAVLLLAGSPFLHLRLASTDVTQLPSDAESRVGTELLASRFPSQGGNVIDVVLDFGDGSPLAAANVAAADRVTRRLAALPGVAAVNGYVNVDPALSLADYQHAYASPSTLPAALVDTIHRTVGHSIALLEAVTPALPASDQAHALVRRIRDLQRGDGPTMVVTGDTAFDIDFVGFILHQTPFAVGFAVLTTFIVLLLLLRSIILPIKAVLMNMLSLSAAFGAMVWVFQDGHLAGALNITPGAIDPTLPVLLFCIVFGLSMDYEVFLLSRMQEAWRRSHDNRAAVAEGLERSGRLITGAAAIMVSVFVAFGLGRVVTIKATGIGLAVAVIVDATLVRALVVPALMRLLGRANWWAPRWVRRLPGGLDESTP